MVRKERLELSRVTPLVPKTSASTNSATLATLPIKLIHYIIMIYIIYYNNDMKNIVFFTIYIIFFAIISSLIFSLLYMQFDEQPIITLSKTIKYGAILMCIIFIVPAMKYRNLYNRKLIGYLEPKIKFITNVLKGFLLSLIFMLPLLILFIGFDIRNINYNLFVFDKFFIYTLIFTLFISLLISFIEESFFRGIMIQKSNNFLSTCIVILLSSLIYSLFHFLKIPLIIDENIYWYTGLREFISIITNFYNIITLDAACTLVLFGILLGTIRVKYKTISYCIGLHTGFVFIIKTFKQNSSVNYESVYSNSYMISSYDHFTGELASIWITVVLFCYLLVIYHKMIYHKKL